MKLDFATFPELETIRLTLRKLSIEDAQAIYELRSNPEVAKLTGKEPFRSIDDALAYIYSIEKLIKNNACLFWAISYKDQSSLIGALCFWNFDIDNHSIEIGYELLPEFQKRGIMVEALAAIINFGFENMAARIITAFPSIHNQASVSLLEKIGFKRASDAYQHTHENVDGMLTYILLNDYA